MSDLILTKSFNDHPHIALLQLNRPKVLNALSTTLMEELANTLIELNEDEQTRAIILTGNERAFAAGADIQQLEKSNPVDMINDKRILAWQKLNLVHKPIIAAVNGFALGAGCELAMFCDLIIAGDNAKFGQPEIKIGTLPGAGGSQRLTRAIGKSKAMYMTLTGEMIDAQTAMAWGLVTKVVPKETLIVETFEIAKEIANKAPIAVRLAKEAVNKAYEMSLRDAMDFERRNFYLSFASEDQKEGMRAFLEKRDPEYKGK